MHHDNFLFVQVKQWDIFSTVKASFNMWLMSTSTAEEQLWLEALLRLLLLVVQVGVAPYPTLVNNKF